MSTAECNPVTHTSWLGDVEDIELDWYLRQVVPYPPVLKPRKLPPRAITYPPKIGPVICRECGQTIRKLDQDIEDRYRVRVGDMITFHGWQGKPYFSPWSRWRLHIEISELEELHVVSEDGFEIHRPGAIFSGKWDSSLGDLLAKRDAIAPATGPELKNVLQRLNKQYGPILGKRFQILRWNPEEAYLEIHHDNQDGDLNG